MKYQKDLTSKQKALKINLMSKIYGSFAEIGAGQEVAASFFKAGGASGTIAKTMSAYDMAFSDAIYGSDRRYVCESRVVRMMQKEFELLPARLPKRALTTNFFAFANTVETLNFKRTNQGHGWIGLRFQLTPESEPNDCIIHVLMHDNEAVRQQRALGIVGVNLIYACYFYHQDAEVMIDSLVDELTPGRIEIDFFKLTGKQFEHVDNRLLSLKLVKKGLAQATMFGADGNMLQPAEELYKKNVLLLRGRFRPVSKVNMDMLETGLAQYRAEPEIDPNRVKVITELSLKNLQKREDDTIDDQDFLDRVDILCSLGLTVMISNYGEYYRLVNFLSKFTRDRMIGIILGIHSLGNIFDEKYYKHLPGGILASFGQLFGHKLKLYVYPAKDKEVEHLYKCDNFKLPFHLSGLFRYLYDNNRLEDLQGVDTSILDIISDEVLKMIWSGNTEWEDKVPTQVAKQIKAKGLFSYKKDIIINS